MDRRTLSEGRCVSICERRRVTAEGQINDNVEARAGSSSRVDGASWLLCQRQDQNLVLPFIQRRCMKPTWNNQAEAALGPRYRVLPFPLLTREPKVRAIISSSFPSPPAPPSGLDSSSAAISSSWVSRTKSAARRGCADWLT